MAGDETKNGIFQRLNQRRKSVCGFAVMRLRGPVEEAQETHMSN